MSSLSEVYRSPGLEVKLELCFSDKVPPWLRPNLGDKLVNLFFSDI